MHEFLTEQYGTPQSVVWALDVFNRLWPGDDGPGHIVYADYNLEDHHIQGCIDSIDAGDTFSHENFPAGHPVFAATRAVLVWLLAVPVEERTSWLANY